MTLSLTDTVSTKYQDDETDQIYCGYRYYGAKTGRWDSRDPMGDEAFLTQTSRQTDALRGTDVYGEVTKQPYLFVANCPVNAIDGYGLWPSSSPWYGIFVNDFTSLPYTHENSVNRVIPGSISDIAQINSADVFVDSGPGQQDTSMSYEHAMRSPDETPATASAEANYWVKRNIRSAQQAYCSCGEMDHETALWYFGLALHTVQDSTSPAHHGFQVWHGTSNPWFVTLAIWHVAGEAFDPGPRSNLDKATLWLWSFMKCPAPALPRNFFTFPADHEHFW